VADYRSIRISAALLLVGLALTIAAQVPHPVGSSQANVDAFTAYAATSIEFYAAIHLAQFTGEALLMLGLVVLFFALNLPAGIVRLLGILGAASGGAALALSAVVTAVDAVALKQAVDAWASAPAAEKAARFASAETIRWLEWGTTAYWSFVMGLALVLLGIVVAWTGRVPRPIGLFMGASGLATIVTGWFTATTGFGGAAVPPTLISFGCLLAFAMWLLIVSWTMNVADGPQVHSRARSDEAVRLTPAGGRG
jgi:hypothetical protein